MTIIDVSAPIRTGMPVFEGDPPVRIERVASLAAGGVCNLSSFEGTLHAGTHIDAPRHFIDGAGGIETISLDALLGPCLVVDATSVDGHITAEDVDALVPRGVQRVLFQTRNGALWEEEAFSPRFVAVAPSAAAELARRNVQLVGIDYLSIAPFDDPAPTHVDLLAAGVVILEGLDLRGALPGPYEIVCLPLLIPGADGAPARALLRRPT